MTIIRDGKEIELTADEIWEAHKEFVINWMIKVAKEISDEFPEEQYKEIGANAFDIYCEGDGLTEYESVEKVVEEWE